MLQLLSHRPALSRSLQRRGAIEGPLVSVRHQLSCRRAERFRLFPYILHEKVKSAKGLSKQEPSQASMLLLCSWRTRQPLHVALLSELHHMFLLV